MAEKKSNSAVGSKKSAAAKTTAEKILVCQTRSHIARPKRQLDTLRALGLGRIGKTAEHQRNDEILGMIRTVSHLVEVHPVKS